MKTTKKDFELFKSECKRWIDIFELNNWKIFFKHGETERNVYATIKIKLDGHIASIYFAEEWEMFGVDNKEKSIKETAKHEVLHLLIGRFSEIANARYITDSEIYEAEEELIRKLEKIIQ